MRTSKADHERELGRLLNAHAAMPLNGRKWDDFYRNGSI